MMFFPDQQNIFTQEVISAISDIIYVLDTDSRQMIFLNSKIADTLYQEQPLNNETILFHSAIHEEDRQKWDDHIRTCLTLKDGQICEIEIRLKIKEGNYRWFRIRNLIFSRNKEGRPSQLTGIITLVEKEGAPQTTFLSLIASDYLETLRQLYVSLEFIIKTDAPQLSHSSRAQLRRSRSMVQKLNLLTGDIVSYATANDTSRGKETVNLDHILDAILRENTERINTADLFIDRSPLPIIQGFPAQIALLFRHILLQQIKFKPEDRPFAIKIFSWQAEQKTPPLPEQDYINIIFRDNGTGFDPAEKESIFDISYQGSLKGGGAGLTIAKRIMEMHGGFITADSIPRQGSEFRCYFPT
jgi:signal transduction histidine kinase